MELMSSCEQGGLNSWVVGKKKKSREKSFACVCGPHHRNRHRQRLLLGTGGHFEGSIEAGHEDL